MLNIYGLYANRVDYWENIFKPSFMKQGNVIMGGSQFYIGRDVIWDPLAQEDPLYDLFLLRMEAFGNYDTKPTKLRLTYRNKRYERR
jgi:hypothetical protein